MLLDLGRIFHARCKYYVTGRMFHTGTIASINSNRRGWSRRIIFCKIPNGSKNFATFFITPRSFLLFISNLHCLIKQLNQSDQLIAKKTTLSPAKSRSPQIVLLMFCFDTGGFALIQLFWGTSDSYSTDDPTSKNSQF